MLLIVAVIVCLPLLQVTKLTGAPAPSGRRYEPDRVERHTVWEERGVLKANFGSRVNTLRRALGVTRRGIFFPMLLEFVVDEENAGDQRWEPTGSGWRELVAQWLRLLSHCLWVTII